MIKNGENVKIVLPFNISEITGERIRLEIKAVTDSGTVNLNDVKVVNIKEVIIVEQIDNTLKISGKLRAGNENKEIAVDISDIGTQTVNTNINGEYSYTVTVSEVSGASKKLTVTLSGIVNYPEYNNVLCAEYKFSNPGYLDEIAAEVDDCTTAEAVKTVLTDDVLIDTGIVAIPVFISANRSEVYNYLSKADITDGIDLLSEIKTAGALSSLNIKSQDLTDMIDEYGALLGTDTVKAHVDNYSNASKETLDNMFKASNVKITDKQSFSYALTEVLVRHEINKKTTYAEQMDLLMTYADDLKLDFSEYNKLSSNKQYNVATKLTNNIKNVTDYSILQSKLDEYVVEAKKSVESGGNSNTSGGSSSGGSGISVAVKPVSNNKTEETVQKYKFTDINNYAWAEESIYALLDKGVISKAEDKKFNPGNNITRAEFAKMAAVLFGYKLNGTETVFVDVTDNNWYFDYVMALYQNGIVNGITENQFGSNEFITRQDICVILQRIIKEEQASDVSFTDIDEAADYAKGAIYVMKGLSILEGYEDGSFRPKNYATRAEIAKILYKISQ